MTTGTASHSTITLPITDGQPFQFKGRQIYMISHPAEAYATSRPTDAPQRWWQATLYRMSRRGDSPLEPPAWAVAITYRTTWAKERRVSFVEWGNQTYLARALPLVFAPGLLVGIHPGRDGAVPERFAHRLRDCQADFAFVIRQVMRAVEGDSAL